MKNLFELNILFIEDDLVDQMALKRMAGKTEIIKGYEVCESLGDANEMLKTKEFDVIVSDYNLSDGKGMEMIANAQNKPLIVVTGMGDESLAVEAMKAGAVDYMVKDVHHNHLTMLPIAIEKAHEYYVSSIAYKEANERYHDLFENSADLIQSIDPEGNFIYVNPSWLSSLGYNNEEVMKFNFLDIVHSDFKEHCMTVMGELMKGKEFKNEEIWFISKSGETVVVEGSISCKFDDFGKPIATRGIFTDVTKSRAVQNKLKASENQYRLIVESANDIIYYCDPYAKLEFINAHGPEFTGYTQKELLGINFSQLVDKDHQASVVQFYSKQFQDKKEFTYLEFPLVKKDGKKLWVGQNLRSLFDDQDPTKIVGYLGVVRNIDERKKMESQLRMNNEILEKRVSWRTRELEKTNSKLRKEIDLRINTEQALVKSEEEYKGLFENAHDAIVIFDFQTEKILEVNQMACHVYGYSRNDFLGLPLSKISTRKKEERKDFFKTIKKDAYTNYELINRCAEGKEMMLEVDATRILYKGVDAILTINNDITQQRETEKRLKQERTKRISALIDGQELERKRLSRELHDGLGQMLTASQIYLRQLGKEVENKKTLELIETTRTIIDNTVEEVRNISHNLMPSVLDDFGLELALKNMVGSINGKYTGKLKFSSRGKSQRLKQDVEIGMYRIAQEALNNALKYSKADQINISLSNHNGIEKMIIKDDGKGFDMSIRPKSSNGNGIYNMAQRSKLIGCDFSIVSLPQKGTEVVVKYSEN